MEYVFKKGQFFMNLGERGVNLPKVIEEYYPHLLEDIKKDPLMLNLLEQRWVNFIQPINVTNSDKEVGFILGLFNPNNSLFIVNVIYLMEEYRGNGLFVDCLEDIMNADLNIDHIFLTTSNLGVIKALSKRGHTISLREGVVKLNDLMFCAYKENEKGLEFVAMSPYYDTIECRTIFMSKDLNTLITSETCDIDYRYGNANPLHYFDDDYHERNKRIVSIIQEDFSTDKTIKIVN